MPRHSTHCLTIRAARRPHVITSSDELFFALDGREVTVDGDFWRIEVCGVHSTGGQHWVQLHLRGPASQDLTVRVPRLEATCVVDIVHQWIEGTLPARLESAVTGKSFLPAVTN